MIIHILLAILLLSFPIKDSTKVNMKSQIAISKIDSLETKVKMIKFKLDSLKQRKK